MHGVMALRGRKRNPAVIRDRSGKSRGEPEVISREVLAVRERLLRVDGVATEHARDAKAGYTLGKLLLRGRANKSDPGGINEDQFGAGERWCNIIHRHAAIMGYKLSTPSPTFIMVSGGGGSGEEPDAEKIQKTRRQFRECYDAVMASSREHGRPIWRILYGVCVENWPVAALSKEDFGDLRIGLNALGRVL